MNKNKQKKSIKQSIRKQNKKYKTQQKHNKAK